MRFCSPTCEKEYAVNKSGGRWHQNYDLELDLHLDRHNIPHDHWVDDDGEKGIIMMDHEIGCVVFNVCPNCFARIRGIPEKEVAVD